MKRLFVFALVIAALFSITPGAGLTFAKSQQAVQLRIATLAPNGSSWMRVFKAWNASLKKATSNQVSLKFYPGGSQGDERDFIRKIRAGQMDGAAVTTTGLGMVVRPVLVLAVPGLFRDYNKIDRVRNALSGKFEAQFEQNGYKLLGWGDVGKARIFSKKPIKRPSDLRSVRPWTWRDELVFSELLRVVGANGVRLGVPEVYPALQTRMVDAVPASAIAAVSLQWYTRLSHVTKQTSGILIGATLLKKEKFDSLSPEHQRAVLNTSKRAHKALAKLIRRDDERAYRTVLSRGLKEVDVSAHQREWDEATRKVRDRLAGRVYPKSLLKSVMSATGG